ncbi:MAG: alpha/beta hydrolase [Solirubrobacterales bacterium]
MNETGQRLLTTATRWSARAFFRTPSGLPIPASLKRRWTEIAATANRTPTGLERGEARLGGVAAETLTPAGAAGSILYIHGGAFFQGSPRVQRPAPAGLALGAGARAYAPRYRLAPEHPFPAALDDCLAAYRALADREEGGIALAGDSAGAGLALSVAIAARDEGLEQPAAIFLICPWVDLSADAEGTRPPGPGTDPILATSHLEFGARDYLAGHDPHDPRCSPLRADLADLPPILVHTAEEDPLRPDAEALAERVAAAGGEVELRRWPLWHDFHLHAGILRQADKALAEGASFIRDRLASA